MLDNIIEKIKTLPPLPKSFHEINQICNSDDPNISSLAKVIEKDAMLVANLLKIANSPLYNFSREIKSVLQAVSLFGLNTTRSFCADISVKKLLNVDIEPYGISSEDFGALSSLQGLMANKWYSKINPEKKDFIFLCALMQEIGKILIANEVVKNNEVVQFKSEIQTSFNIDEVEKSFVGVTTTEVTAAIFEHWQFEQSMIDTISLSKNPISQEVQNKESIALYIIRKAIPINSMLSDKSINIALNALKQTDFNIEVFNEVIEIVKGKNN